MSGEPTGVEGASGPGDPGEREPGDRDDGVDVTLVRWMLSLTPRERLQVLQDHVRAVLRLRERVS